MSKATDNARMNYDALLLTSEVELDKRYPYTPNTPAPDVSEHKVKFVSRPARKKMGWVFVIYQGYKSEHEGKTYDIWGEINNEGFDCNYAREWKTLKGAIKFFLKNYGKIIT